MDKVVSPQLLVVFGGSTAAIYALLNSFLSRVAAKRQIKKSDWVIKSLIAIAALIGAAGISLAAILIGAVPIGC